MLQLVEKFIAPIRKIASDIDATAVMRQICLEFGFRKACLVEYAPDLRTARRVLDTDSTRQPQLAALFADAGLDRNIEAVRWMLERGNIVVLNESRFAPGDPFIETARRCDMAEGTAVPVSLESDVAGMVFFSGHPDLDNAAELALLLLSYNLFCQVRGLTVAVPVSPVRPLTPREHEIMALSALGLTSLQIARQLAISARTVNQHVDNVAGKLGTRNRAHTVAELIRRGMLREAG